MPKHFLSDDGTGVRSKISLKDARAFGGAAGDIFEVVGRPDVLVKLYRSSLRSAEDLGKIKAMLDSPPPAPFVDRKRVVRHKLAWPTHLIFDQSGAFRGFAMPRLDTLAPVPLESVFQAGSRKALDLRDDNRLRIAMARDLASIVGQLHAREHFVIDLKPQNLLCDGLGYVAMLDADGFSINGPRRYPAREFSADYIAPEAHTAQPDALGLSQDLFALAVIVFKLLNNGIHPFQGVPRTPQPTAIQDRIYERLYGYGVQPLATVGPTPASIHEYFDPETRRLFDRSFAGPANDRPSALEWHTHLVRLESAILRPCRRDRTHSQFGLGCGLCALDDRMRGRSPKPPETPKRSDARASRASQPAYSAMPGAARQASRGATRQASRGATRQGGPAKPTAPQAAARRSIARRRWNPFARPLVPIMVLATWVLLGRIFGGTPGSEHPISPRPEAEAAVATVARYYDLWDAKRYAEMYPMLSRAMRRKFTYASYAASHAKVVHISVTPKTTTDPEVVSFELTSVDLDDGGGTTTNRFTGFWHVITEDGKPKLDDESLTPEP